MDSSTKPRRQDVSDILTMGFGTTIAMWAAGYFSRLPVVDTPPVTVGVIMLVIIVLGGWVAGRATTRGWVAGVWTGAVAWALNLLILGSLLTATDSPNRIMPSALIWLPGSLLAFLVLATVGSAIGAASQRRPMAGAEWLPRFACVAAGATFLLILAGGLVTSAEEGLAVVDWPNSFGYNMFLYPLSRMTGGIYYEHAHRLLGSLVGFTTLVLAVTIQAGKWPRWIKVTGWLALLLVVFQGILGGLRVTGFFTTSTDPSVVEPNIYLAITHGVVGQVFFTTLIALSVFLAGAWHAKLTEQETPAPATENGLPRVLVAMLIIQLVLGAILRHIFNGLHIHIAFAVVVLAVAAITGIRAWGMYPTQPRLNKGGLLLASLALLQLILGLLALVATGSNTGEAPNAWNLVLATAHQTAGALLLAVAVYVMLWIQRLVKRKVQA